MPPRRPDFRPKPLGVRWLEKVDRTGTCWLWTGALDSHGYGKIQKGAGERKVLFAHRVGYELFVGPVPKGLYIDHLCRNRQCVRPDHLEPVTNWENIRRGNGWTAQRARSTSCIRGHEFTPENTYHYGPGKRWRQCRTCSTARARIRYS